jgi:LysR family transcriptional regulator, glycine cleavage system transcriptional activator
MMHSLPLSMPPVDCLAAALVAVRTESFTQAALELGVSHATVSRRIATAENWAGIRLFLRNGRGVSVTDDGQRLLSRVAHAFDIVDQAANQWRKSSRRKSLRIATTHSLAQLWLIPRLADIETALSDFQIDLVTSHAHADLAAGDADIAIRCGRGGWKIGREERLFPEETLLPVASATFIDALVKTSDPERLLHLPLIHSPDTSGWQTWAQTQGFTFRGKMSDRLMSDYVLAHAAARSGLGVALMNSALMGASNVDKSAIAGCQPLDMPGCASPLNYFIIVPPHQETRPIRDCVAQLLRLANQQ